VRTPKTGNPGFPPVWEREMDEQQLAVIRHTDGPLQVLAQAGAGKTRSAVHRVARLVAEGVPGDRILMVTFSKKAADEMDARCRHLGIGSVECMTWHKLCLRILREDGTPQSQWNVDDKDRAKLHVKKAMGYEHVNWIGGDLTKVRRFIAHCKANLFDPDSEGACELATRQFRHQAPKALRVFSISQDLIEEAGLLTFDDMLVFAHRHLLDENNRAGWAGRFDYVITDEAQDNNLAQVVLQEMLARDHRNLQVTGDLAQAIFAFRGSSPAYLAEFLDKWQASRIAMMRNYRSGRAIVRFANDVIRPTPTYRQPEDMIAMRDVEGRVEEVACHTLEDEAGELVAFLKREVPDRRKLSDVCVIFRTNAQSRSLEEALLKEKMPYQIIGGTNFYERKEVKDLLGYLRVAAGRDRSGDAVKRCINAPFRFLGAKFVDRVMALGLQWLQSETPFGEVTPWPELVDQAAGQAGIQQRQVASAHTWAEMIGFVAKRIEVGASAYEVLDEVVRRTGYIAWLEKEEGEESIESSHAANVREMLRVAANFKLTEDLLDYVDRQVADSERQRRNRQSADKLTLMSIHRSKGLEWPVVWIVGCNEGILPHGRNDDIEEERRLMYVAVTRARDHLVVSHVRELATRVGLKTVERSRFLESLEVSPPAHGQIEMPECESAEELTGRSMGFGVDYGRAGGDETAVVTMHREGGEIVVDDVRTLRAFDASIASIDPSQAGQVALPPCWNCGADATVVRRVFGVDDHTALCGACDPGRDDPFEQAVETRVST
jgi:ATP-dependent DNA helicase UvrD/PcrA